MNNIAIVIIVYNTSDLIFIQINLIKKFCKDNIYDIIVVDNSNDRSIASEVEQCVRKENCQYIKTNTKLSTTQSHAYACNTSYNFLKNKYKYLFFLDHDNFPLQDFSIKDILIDKIVAGVGQIRAGIEYFWPGCLMIDNNKINHDLLDFSHNDKLGLDTGGNLYKIIETYGKEKCIFFDQREITNQYNKSFLYTFYNDITYADKLVFMHFLNASNWNYDTANDERLKTLLMILNERVS